MKLTYEERLLVVEDHKRNGTAYTSRLGFCRKVCHKEM